MRNPVALLTFALAALLTVGSCALAWVFLLQPMQRAVATAGKLEAGFRERLGVVPRISVDRGAIHAQQSDREEIVLGVSEGPVEADAGDGTRVRASYRAEAGFYTRDRFEVAVRAGGEVADCSLPHVKITSISVGGIDGGDAASRPRLERVLGNVARRNLVAEGFVETARGELRARVEAIGEAAGCAIEFGGEGDR